MDVSGGVRGGDVSLVVHLGETHGVCRAPGVDLHLMTPSRAWGAPAIPS
jgi:hypothetical protein